MKMIAPLFIILAICAASIDGSIPHAGRIVEGDEDLLFAARTHGPADPPPQSDSKTEYEAKEPPEQGTTYTRWGLFECPSLPGTSLVYYGYAAGTWYGHSGGGVGPICLPAPTSMELQYLETQPGFQRTGLLYGAEYEMNYFTPLSDLHNKNVPCAVCEVAGRASMLMIPGVLKCPAGWRVEYKGYLMSSHIHQASQNAFSCVDEDPKFIRGSSANNDGLVFYTYEIDSSPGLCPPFECNGKELSCVVCTK